MVVASVHRTKAKPRDPRCSIVIRNSRLNSSSSRNSSSNSRRLRHNSSRNNNARQSDSWADRRRTTVAYAGAVVAVARGIIDPALLHFVYINAIDSKRDC